MSEDKLEVEGKVIESSKGIFRVKLENDHVVIGHLSGKMKMSSDKIEELFNRDLKNKTESTREFIKNYDSLSPTLQSELIQLNYRGDLEQSPNTRRLINEGKFREAAKELLNHEEYKALKAQNIDNSITRRLEAARDALLKEADK